MPPGRSRRSLSPVTSTTVDSTPTPQLPPSTTAAILPSRSSSTCCAVVVDGRPDALADGAAMGTAASSISARATGCAGKRTATVSSPAETSSGTAPLFFITMVSGPGQNARARRCASGGTCCTRPES